MYEQKGIDVSSWQGDIDWKQVKQDNIEFSMIRAAAGTKPDQKFVQNIQGALKQGIPCGTYLYSLADTVPEAVAEANYILKIVKPYQILLPIAYDIEDKVHHSLSDAQRTDLIDAFCHTIGNAGYHPMFYSSFSWFQTMFELQRLTQYDKWVAQWGVNKTDFSPAAMWQYSSKASVSGIRGNVDLNVVYKDYSIKIPETKPIIKKPSVAEQTPHLSVPIVSAKIKTGQPILLSHAPLFISAADQTKNSEISGTYWIYDSKVNNKRLRITNNHINAGKLPASKYVTGYINLTDIKRYL